MSHEGVLVALSLVLVELKLNLLKVLHSWGRDLLNGLRKMVAILLLSQLTLVIEEVVILCLS